MTTSHPLPGAVTREEVEARRNDPVLRQAWKERVETNQAAFAEAHRLLREAVKALRGIDTRHDPLLGQARDAGAVALMKFDNNAALIMTPPSEIYLGNLATRGAPPVR